MGFPIYCPHCGTGPGYPEACKCMENKFQKMEAGEDGWCEWVRPPLQGYKMKCCDCGLVHEMEFKAFAETNQGPDKTYEVVELPWPIRVMFRARRHEPQ